MTDDYQRVPCHENRYEGFRNYDPEEGTVERFDAFEAFRWVQLQLDDVPDDVIRRRVG